MNAQSMLEQLLKSGLSMIEGKRPDTAQAPTHAGAGANAGVNAGASGADAGWGKFGAGAATGGALGLLLGSKRGRRLGGKAVKYGSVAALGVMAFRAYSNWQAQQAQQAQSAQPSAAPVQPSVPALPSPQTVNLLSGPEVEQHSRGMLKAMIAAAKADGHLDERERGLVEAELQRSEADADTRRWFEQELRRPLDPAEVAQGVASPELAAEMYLASLLMVDETNFMERAYLDELARQLRVPEGLKRELERQALAA